MEDKQILDSAAGKYWRRMNEIWDDIKTLPNIGPQNELFNAAFRLMTQGNLESAIIASEYTLKQDNPKCYEEKMTDIENIVKLLEELKNAMRSGKTKMENFSLSEQYAETASHCVLYTFETENYNRVSDFFKEHAIPSSLISVPGTEENTGKFAALIDAKYERLVQKVLLNASINLHNTKQGKVGLVPYRVFEDNCFEEKVKLENVPFKKFEFLQAEMAKRNLLGGFAVQSAPGSEDIKYNVFIPKRSLVEFEIINFFADLAMNGLAGKNNILALQQIEQKYKDTLEINSVLETSKRSKQYLFADKKESYLIVDDKGLKFYPVKNEKTNKFMEISISRDKEDFDVQYRRFAEEIRLMGLVHVPASQVTVEDSQLKNMSMPAIREFIFNRLTSGLDCPSTSPVGAPPEVVAQNKETVFEYVDKSFTTTPLITALIELAQNRSAANGTFNFFDFVDKYLELIEKVRDNIDCLTRLKEAEEILEEIARNPNSEISVDIDAVRKELEESDRELKIAFEGLDEYGLKYETKELLISSITDACNVEYDSKNGIVKVPATATREDMETVQKNLLSFATKIAMVTQENRKQEIIPYKSLSDLTQNRGQDRNSSRTEQNHETR